MIVTKFVRILLLFLITILATRCVEPYEPEVIDYESTLAVDGFFSDSDSPSQVVLSRSFGFDEDIPEYIDNAEVTIEDDQGKTFILLPMGNGTYETDPLAHKGEIGKTYRLLINILGGSQYVSSWETMLAATPIGEIETEYQERELNNSNAQALRGIQLFLSNEDTNKDVSFYKWEYEETYQFSLRFDPLIEVEFGNNPGNGQDTANYIPQSRLQGATCYKTEQSKNILIGSTEGLSENRISRFPFVYVSDETSRLDFKYSILIKQFSISKEYHENLRKVAEVNQTSGSLFDPIPNEIFGNIKNIENEREPVLGYFGVGGVSEKRTFVDRSLLPMGFAGPIDGRCVPDSIPLDFANLHRRIVIGSSALSRYYYNLNGDPIGYILTDPACVYCTANGATNQVPDFW